MNDLATADVAIELRQIERDESIPRGVRAHIFRTIDQIFALDLDRAEALVALTPEQSALLSEREAARADKDYARSDELRDQLLALKIAVKDGPGGQSYEVIS